MLFDIDFGEYWYLLMFEVVFIDVANVNIIVFPITTFDNELIMTMGISQPWHPNSAFHCKSPAYVYNIHSLF
jgi:hypothetical protein